jgi:hypothetical protein
MGWFLGGPCHTCIRKKKIDWFMGGWCNTCIWQEKYVKKEINEGRKEKT